MCFALLIQTGRGLIIIDRGCNNSFLSVYEEEQMRIIHFTNSLNNNLISEEIAQDLKIEYNKMTINDLSENNFKNAILVILDYNEEIEIEEIVKYINLKSKGLIPCIIVGEDIDFITKKRLYHLGASSVMESLKKQQNKLRELFNFARQQNNIIEQLKKVKIAVVDDSRLTLEIIKDYFIKADILSVDYFNSPDEFIKKPFGYDIYIVDLVMPNYTGQELIQLIKSRNSNAIILIITTYGEGLSIPQSLTVGAVDFLIKPFSFKLFMLRLVNSMQSHILKNQKSENQKKLYELATQDHLTGLYNRRYFANYLSEKINTYKDNRKEFSLILFDLDYFKTINDEYGHLAGDKVLITIAEYIAKKFRKSDVIARWGGEEFIIFLSNSNIAAANEIAEKLRYGIELLEIEGVRQVTASFGVTQFEVGDTASGLFKRIDNSLYLAKFTGRNKIVSNEELAIINGDLPLNIEWGPFFRSGNQIIDQEHNNLIALSNKIILNSFKSGNDNKVKKLFVDLVHHIVEHFKNEEKILSAVGYSDVNEHKRIHDNLVDKTKKIMEKLEKNQLSTLEVSKYVIQEVVVGHIVKIDFEYYYLFK